MKKDTSLLDELKQLILRHAASHAARPALPNVVLSSYSVPTQPVRYIAEPALALVVQGAKQVALGEQVFRYAAGQYLIYLVDLPLSSNVIQASEEEPLLGLGLVLRPEVIASLLLESSAPPKKKGEQSSIAVSELSDDLLDSVVRLIRLLDKPNDIPILAQSIEREILWRLINGEQGAMVRQLGHADSRTMQIVRAIKWIRDHYAETIRIEKLADVAGMSTTSFYRHFLAATSLSPIQFQKHVRLQTARSLLASSLRGVADIGLAVGYDSPSQFSREYHRLFGRPPREDGKILRKNESD
ncbi:MULTISPECIES: AraC family transcriptional regulator [unclassified Pseudomonas]|uniref:AraC family transcriptional regulator n=1 Tax=unclassified Pseudomonas TaxID=196821 RepID=UPI0015A2F671|nr:MULTISPECIES: AraC family transcriptional regulator [unclassified Pseudomonas]NWC92762.1 AraC family transcriptional regulator [Pseudomonas sp. IPO3779]NWD17476.1 AraC family transcriptional regulator [Pseudomonas sp. IPO3778]